MTRRCVTPLLTLLLTVCAHSTCSAQGDKLVVETDPRVELLSAALTQSVWAPTLKGYFSAYAQDAQKTFFPHRGHPAVKRLDALHSRGVGLRDLYEWVVTRGPLPDLASLGPADPAFTKQAGGAEALDAVAAALAEFARAAGFEVFQERSGRALSEVTATLLAGTPGPKSAIDRLEAYTGMSRERYHLVAAPLLGNTFFSWMDPAGKHAYALVSPTALRGAKLAFDSAAADTLVYLGFGRDFARELVEANPRRLEQHEEWFGYLDDSLRKLGIGDWKSTVVELFAVATAVRLLEMEGKTSKAAELRRAMTGRGLAWLPYVLPRLAAFEHDRNRYPTLKEFGPRLFDALDELEPVFAGGEPGELGLTDVWLTDFGLPVKAVAAGSLAAKAGIRSGDTIQAIGGIRINGSESYLNAWDRWEKAANNEAVDFRVKRGKTVLTVKVLMKRAGAFQGFRRKPAAI
jgi:hypothetical protein